MESNSTLKGSFKGAPNPKGTRSSPKPPGASREAAGLTRDLFGFRGSEAFGLSV